jgi:hypothetical protein
LEMSLGPNKEIHGILDLLHVPTSNEKPTAWSLFPISIFGDGASWFWKPGLTS